MPKKHLVLGLAVWGLVAACSGKNSNSGAMGGAGGSGADGQAGAASHAGAPAHAGASAHAGSASVAGSSSGGDDTVLGDFASVYTTAICRVYGRCWKTLVAALNEDCQNYLERLFREQALGNLEAAIEAGTVEYHPEALAGCVAALDQTACDATQLPPCEQLFVGTKQTGEDCSIDQECGYDSECLPGPACPGKCAKRGGIGAVCNSVNHCAQELECVEPASGDGKCVAPLGAGKACNAASPCGGLLDCIGVDTDDPQSMGTCQNRDAIYSASENEACSLTGVRQLCRPGLSCVFAETTAGLGTCQPPLAANAPCQLALPEQCPSGQYCKITSEAGVSPRTGLCTKTPGLGEACGAAGATYTGCDAEQYCDTASGVCAMAKHLGEACAQNHDCLSIHCGADGTCSYPLDCEPPP